MFNLPKMILKKKNFEMLVWASKEKENNNCRFKF